MSGEDVVAPRVGVDDLGAVARLEPDLENSGHRRGLDGVDPDTAEFGFDRLPDLRLVGERGEREQGGGKQREKEKFLHGQGQSEVSIRIRNPHLQPMA